VITAFLPALWAKKFCCSGYLSDPWKSKRENVLAKKMPDPDKKGQSGIKKGHLAIKKGI
jgi:hypothetical protein